jgi:hypothetical protein
MNAPATFPDVPPTFWQDFTRRIIMAAIKARGISDSERKERVMLARQCGFLSDEETEDYIVFWGLVHD